MGSQKTVHSFPGQLLCSLQLNHGTGVRAGSVPGIVMLHGLEGNEEELLRLVRINGPTGLRQSSRTLRPKYMSKYAHLHILVRYTLATPLLMLTDWWFAMQARMGHYIS